MTYLNHFQTRNILNFLDAIKALKIEKTNRISKNEYNKCKLFIFERANFGEKNYFRNF